MKKDEASPAHRPAIDRHGLRKQALRLLAWQRSLRWIPAGRRAPALSHCPGITSANHWSRPRAAAAQGWSAAEQELRGDVCSICAESMLQASTSMDASSQSIPASQSVQTLLSDRSNRKSQYAAQLKVAALSLFIFFITIVLNALLPPSLLNPAWLMRLASTLISNAFLPLIGIALINLAVVIHPGRQLEDYSKSLAKWAVLASVGFLLLLPLQAWSSWRLIKEDFTSLERGRPTADEPLMAMEKAIREAPDAASMQTRLTILRGPAISPQDMARPLPELKQMLLSSLQQARANLLKRQNDSPDPRIWVLIQDVARFSIASLGFAAAFAAFAQRMGAKSSLLKEISDNFRFHQTIQRNAAKRNGRSRRRRSSSS